MRKNQENNKKGSNSKCKKSYNKLGSIRNYHSKIFQQISEEENKDLSIKYDKKLKNFKEEVNQKNMELIQENQNLKNKIENNTYIIELKNKIEEKKINMNRR